MFRPDQDQNQNKYKSKLESSRILILGGTSGIGFCIAEACLEHSASVIISSSNPNKLDTALTRLKDSYPAVQKTKRLAGYACDLSDPGNLEAHITHLFEQMKEPVNHIASTAGDAFKLVPVAEASVDYIQRLGTVRFLAPIILAKIAPKYLVPGPTGSSITLTSGTNGPKPAPNWTILAGYCGAIEGIARGLAKDLAPTRVNVVSPGAVHTELFNDIPKEKLDGVLEGMARQTLVGRVGKPEEVAEAYLYAMKDGFVTGKVLQSDGGRLLA